jgi:cytochrome c peroxidase
MSGPVKIVIAVAFMAAAGGLLVLAACQRQSASPVAAEPMPTWARSGLAVLPLPAVPELPPAKIALGRSLFLDARLSRDDSIACASCHDLTTAGHDKRRFSVGVDGAVGTVNAPTVFNAALNFAQFWDGRADSLEEQAAGPVHNPVEMGSDWPQVVAKLSADADLVSRFQRVYGHGPTAASIVDAIAAFERTLLTVDAPLDRYLRGDTAAIEIRAKEGFRLFREIGCVSCHQGANLGGNMFQRFGVMAEPQRSRAGEVADLGRFNVTGREEDRHVFKVPSLRNVALTAPYFHDGSAATLEEAVATMGNSQLGRDLSPAEIDLLVTFLGTLSGKRPATAMP